MDKGTRADEVAQVIMETYGQYDQFSKELYCVIMDKAEGEAYDKVRSVSENNGILADLSLYKWFTEISGLGLTEQARRLRHLEPPKKEEELSECIDHWVERVRRFDAHGTKYALPALYKVTALRLMMIDKAKEHFEIWEAEHEADEDGGFNEIRNNIRDYARR